ncbi:hypothetical protein M3231_21985 [Neobacillus mesonae]|nr:hypothetical protein [Neobacillus mesonae]
MKSQTWMIRKPFTKIYLIGATIALAIALFLWTQVPSAESPPAILSSVNEDSSSLQISFPLEKYSSVMSSVPGFPIEISEENTAFPLKITASSGNLLLMGGSTGNKVISHGESLQLEHGDMIYWSPLASPPVSEAVITVTGQSLYQNSAAGTTSIRISQDKDGFYKIN